MANASLLSEAQIQLSSYRKYCEKRGAEEDRGHRDGGGGQRGRKIVMISFQSETLKSERQSGTYYALHQLWEGQVAHRRRVYGSR